MNWKAHVAVGMILSAIAFYFLFKTLDPMLVAIAGFAALIPDLDTELSKGKKLLDLVVILLAGIIAITTKIWILFFAIVGAYFILYKFFKPKHRGITHTILSCLVFSVLVYFVAGTMPAFATFLGYLSHLLLDKL